MRYQQFLKIIEAITMKGQDKDKRHEEIRIAEARETKDCRRKGEYSRPNNVWLLTLAPLLTGKAQAAYANMDAGKSKEFEEVKQAILKRYNINEQMYRQQFQSTKKKTDESYVETGVRLKDLSAKWLKPTERTKEDLVNVIIHEQLPNAMPKELQLRVSERKSKTSENAATLADIISARDSIFNINDGVRKCLNRGKPGHLARDCRHIQRKRDGSRLGELRDDRKRSNLPQKRETQLTCCNCGKVEHFQSGANVANVSQCQNKLKINTANKRPALLIHLDFPNPASIQMS